MDNVEKLKKVMVFVRDQMCPKTDCQTCEFNNPDGACYSIPDIMRNALSVIEKQQAEIERLKGIVHQKEPKWENSGAEMEEGDGIEISDSIAPYLEIV